MARDPFISRPQAIPDEGGFHHLPHLSYPRHREPEVAELEPVFDRAYINRLVTLVKKSLDDMAQYYIDLTNRVDEYRVEASSGPAESLTTTSLLPDYECDEIITSVLVNGPPGACTLQLGKRVWALTVPASGILVIAPVQIKLGRSDNRQLTGGAAGDWSFELMGYAETGRRGRV